MPLEEFDPDDPQKPKDPNDYGKGSNDAYYYESDAGDNAEFQRYLHSISHGKTYELVEIEELENQLVKEPFMLVCLREGIMDESNPLVKKYLQVFLQAYREPLVRLSELIEGVKTPYIPNLREEIREYVNRALRDKLRELNIPFSIIPQSNENQVVTGLRLLCFREVEKKFREKFEQECQKMPKEKGIDMGSRERMFQALDEMFKEEDFE